MRVCAPEVNSDANRSMWLEQRGWKALIPYNPAKSPLRRPLPPLVFFSGSIILLHSSHHSNTKIRKNSENSRRRSPFSERSAEQSVKWSMAGRSIICCSSRHQFYNCISCILERQQQQQQQQPRASRSPRPGVPLHDTDAPASVLDNGRLLQTIATATN